MKTESIKHSYGIHWFRRDLRLVGNPALEANLALHEGRVLGFFCFDPQFLARKDFSANRFLFFLRTLEKLREEMREQGGDLLIYDRPPTEAWPALIRELEKTRLSPTVFGTPTTVSWNRDYEPFARNRDEKAREFFDQQKIQTITERDHLLIEPSELRPPSNEKSFYQIYTPFKKTWYQLFETSPVNHRLREQNQWIKRGKPEFSLRWPSSLSGLSEGRSAGSVLDMRISITHGDPLVHYLKTTQAAVKISLPPVGHEAAVAALKKFKQQALEKYSTGRDIPSIPGTSQMSIYLKNGTVTVPQIIAYLKLLPGGPHEKYFNELVWREFYYHILFHRPDVETSAFLKQYEKLEWENSPDLFQAWCEGKTGFPIVDAGMRQLNETGWMHNRVRMIVASFLTKDLLIDYKWGERYFMEKLLDGDLAPNNGGWQWAASTGCDPQPYFRIFNPETQAQKFDPEGKYILRWCPEYAGESLKTLHLAKANAIVDHSQQRKKALKMYADVRKTKLEK